MATVDGPDSDTWMDRDGHGWYSCSYCGSLHPDQFMEFSAKRAEVGPTDKDYKAYIDLDTGKPAEDKEETSPNGNKRSWTEGGVVMLKFYFQHLTKEQRIEFVRRLNAKELNIGPPGHFYRLSFFCVPAKPDESSVSE